MLAAQLLSINEDENFFVNHDYTYDIVDPDLVLALGKVRLVRSDSSDIQIRTSSGYPVQIREIMVD